MRALSGRLGLLEGWFLTGVFGMAVAVVPVVLGVRMETALLVILWRADIVGLGLVTFLALVGSFAPRLRTGVRALASIIVAIGSTGFLLTVLVLALSQS